MDRFKKGVSFLIVLASILVGIGAAILHPYVHVLNRGESPSSQQAGKTHQELAHIDSPDDCYVCTFSKKFALDGITALKFEFALFPDPLPISPLFSRSFGYDSVISLRGPPLV